MDTPDDATLISVAQAISNGAPVDWTRVRDAKDADGVATVLREMAVLELIAKFHHADQAGAPAAVEAPDPERWGRFTIRERIGVGAFGVVYRAYDTKLQTEVALKLLSPTRGGMSIDPARAVDEARKLARVAHPNVVRVYDTTCEDGRVGIWMELVKGETLEAILRARGPFGASEAALVGVELCRALAAVHGAGLVHGDVKAHNVMRAEGGHTILMDLGAGKALDARSAGSDVAGTPLYLAPEVFTGAQRSTASDIYSLGVLLYHLVTNAYPVPGTTREEVERAHRESRREYLRDKRPDLPPAFVRVVERALATDPHARWQSAGAFEAELASLLDRPPRPNPPFITLAIAALSITLAVAYALSARRGTPQPPQSADSAPTTADAAAAPAADDAIGTPYDIDATFYRARDDGEDRLSAGARVGPGDKLFARVRVSRPVYLYVVNEDDGGDSYLLFPLPGQELTNPVPPNVTHRIPGADAARTTMNWQVTSAAGHEHFLVFASMERVGAFEKMFASLPHPEVGRRIESARIPADAIGRLRGVGGLAPASREAPRLAVQFSTPLAAHGETARGLWIRQLTLDNPAR